jgi:hypothetical protein
MSKIYHEQQRELAQAQERLENERKLAHLNLIQESREDDQAFPSSIPAEFMPMPGTVPHPQKRDQAILAEQGIYNINQGMNGPWGGRFKIASRAKRLNVLNLFDISLNLPKTQTDNDEYYSDE